MDVKGAFDESVVTDALLDVALDKIARGADVPPGFIGNVLTNCRYEIEQLRNRLVEESDATTRYAKDRMELVVALREWAEDRLAQAATWDETPQRGSVEYDARRVLSIVNGEPQPIPLGKGKRVGR